jgi:hypothetical protein
VKSLSIAFVVVALAMFSSPAAGADPPPPDPHMPDYRTRYCPGGSGVGLAQLLWCDGVPYPDGSYWHQLHSFDRDFAFPTHLFCVTGAQGVRPPPAPPGGCLGAV